MSRFPTWISGCWVAPLGEQKRTYAILSAWAWTSSKSFSPRKDVFRISIPDAEAGKISTFGQLYEFVCASLNLPPSATRPVGTGRAHPIRKLRITPDLDPWTHEDVWATLIAIFVEQMQFEPDEIWYDARIGPDLGIE